MQKIICLFIACIVSITFYGQWTTVGTNIYNTNSGNVGTGTTSPQYALSFASGGKAGFYYDSSHYSNIEIFNNYTSDMNFSLGFDGANYTFMGTGSGGNVGIGLTNPTEKLSVNGNIRARKIIITKLGWSDYVFNDDYKLRSLLDVAQFIKQNKHLPDVPSAKEVEDKGIDLGDNQALLLKKIEELTLYVIELKEENKRQDKKINQIVTENKKLKQIIKEKK